MREYGQGVLFIFQFIRWSAWELGPGLHGDDQAIPWMRLDSAFVPRVPVLSATATLSSAPEA